MSLLKFASFLVSSMVISAQSDGKTVYGIGICPCLPPFALSEFMPTPSSFLFFCDAFPFEKADFSLGRFNSFIPFSMPPFMLVAVFFKKF